MKKTFLTAALIASVVTVISLAGCKQSRAEDRPTYRVTQTCWYRSAVTGRYVTRDYALVHPGTTYRSCTRQRPARPPCRRCC